LKKHHSDQKCATGYSGDKVKKLPTKINLVKRFDSLMPKNDLQFGSQRRRFNSNMAEADLLGSDLRQELDVFYKLSRKVSDDITPPSHRRKDSL
jgi:hypothetical protein